MKEKVVLWSIVFVALLGFLVASSISAMGARPATRIIPDQLAINVPTASLDLGTVKLLAYSGSAFYEVYAGNNVSITLTSTGGTNALLVNATATAPPVTVVYPDMNVAVTRQADGSYSLAKSPGTKVIQLVRNGLVQSAPGDYSYNAAANLVVPSSPWAADDTVQANFFPVQ